MKKPSFNLKKTRVTIAVLFFVAVSGIYQCKSSVEEDLAPIEMAKDNTVAAISSSNNFVNNTTLKSAFSFPFGAAVVKELLENKAYSDALKRDYSSLSSQSNMKFRSLHPSEDTYTFDKADYIVNFAQANNMRVHGHVLIWGKDATLPAWVLNNKGDKAAFEKIMKSHIQTVVKHFKGKVASWDVVNEAYADNGTLKDNIWLRKIGPGYIDKAFAYAHAADPSAKLFYNDYGQEFGGSKMRAIMAMVKNLKSRNIRIDGMGFQMHTVLRITVSKIQEQFLQVANAGLLVHVSEMDISVKYQQPKYFDFTSALDTELAAKYKEIVQAYLTAVPKKLQFGITTWGVGDADAYNNVGVPARNADYPLLFDKNYVPKKAYKSVIEAGLGK